jgi:hypothetical protein
MSVPPDLMKLMAGGAGEKTAPGPNPMEAAAPGNAAPPGGPMSVPQPKEGETQAAMVKLAVVFQQLESALPAFGAQTEEGKTIVKVLGQLGKVFGDKRQKADSLIPAEMVQMMQNIPGAGGGSPAAKAIGGIPPQVPGVPPGGGGAPMGA